MANYYNKNRYSDNSNYGNRQYSGGYQQSQYQAPPPPPITPEEFFSKRIDVYLSAIETIKSRGLDVGDFAFALGGWVTSYVLEEQKRN